ncbi:hypothetical protein [Oricola thermophila]|uniref:Phage tail assembly protein n=1 Tax=Oricola thermophila TaxID=2742145 RepID=A0A6N1VH53_9HYPH|nr:hypothetical protein [Oricola thermophila]QKV20241.1 hypothetical protein HTY61_18180 [Oricola thermophila]
MPGTTIELSRTYGEGSEPFSSLTFREPRWQDFVDLGEIEEWQPVGGDDGTHRPMVIRHHDVVAAYAERLVMPPRTAADLQVLDLKDALSVHGVIRDFFATARASTTPQAASSGGTEKGSTKSAD